VHFRHEPHRIQYTQLVRICIASCCISVLTNLASTCIGDLVDEDYRETQNLPRKVDVAHNAVVDGHSCFLTKLGIH
jgi:hypothetical protein